MSLAMTVGFWRAARMRPADVLNAVVTLILLQVYSGVRQSFECTHLAFSLIQLDQ
jgi:hypothetical protein